MNATWSSLTKTECLKYKGELVGKACEFVPDIALMSFILFFGTYTCSMCLKKFKTSPFFPTTVSHTHYRYLIQQVTRQRDELSVQMFEQAGYSEVFVLTFTQVRKLISDFAIILAILIFCGVDMLIGVDTPKLIVPTEFKVSPLPAL